MITLSRMPLDDLTDGQTRGFGALQKQEIGGTTYK